MTQNFTLHLSLNSIYRICQVNIVEKRQKEAAKKKKKKAEEPKSATGWDELLSFTDNTASKKRLSQNLEPFKTDLSKLSKAKALIRMKGSKIDLTDEGKN